MGAERPWEKSYPPGVRWDAPSRRRRCRRCSMPSPPTWAAKPALEYRDRKTSYAELRAGVDAVASGLMDLGVGPGTSVALYLPNTPYHPLSFFAALKAGGRIVHLSPLDAERELAHKLQDSGARILVTTNIGFMLLLAQKLQRDGLVDHLIVGDDTAFGPSAIPTTPIADAPGLVRFDKLSAEGARQAAAAMAGGERGGRGAAAVHRRHHRQAQGRHAEPCQPQRRLLDLQALERPAAHVRCPARTR